MALKEGYGRQKVSDVYPDRPRLPGIYLPKSLIASITILVPVLIIRISDATRTKRYPLGGDPMLLNIAEGKS